MTTPASSHSRPPPLLPRVARAIAMLLVPLAAVAAREERRPAASSFASIDARLRVQELRIASVEDSPKSDHATTLKVTLEDGLELKFRVADDLGESRRNEDPKLTVASYVVSQMIVPDRGPVLPARLRSIPLATLEPHLPAETLERLRPWARGGLLWGALSLYKSGGVRAEDSRFYGGHLGPSADVDGRALPLGFVRSLGDLNVVATLTHNGDLHGDNWEIRESDGACFVIDSGISFTFDGVLPYQKRFRKPCDPLARAYAASTIARVQRLLDNPEELDAALARLDGTRWGLSAEARKVVLDQARELMDCWKRAEKVEVGSRELEKLLRAGSLAPFREREEGPLYLVTDW